MKRTAFILAAAALLHFQQATAQKTLTTSAAFLRVSPDIRGAALGDAGIGTTPDAYSNFRNIAKIPFAKDKASVNASYTPWLSNATDGIYMAAAGGYYKLGEDQGLTAGIRYFKMGTARFADEAGNYLADFNPAEFAADAGYTRKISARVAIGVGLRYINSRIASGTLNGDTYKTASAVSGDVSAFYNGVNAKGNGFSAGVNISNLGAKLSYASNSTGGFLPATAGIGASYTITDHEHRFLFTGEFNKPLVPVTTAATDLQAYNSMGVAESWIKSFKTGNLSAVQYSAGVEYAWEETFFVRLGGLLDGKARMGGNERCYFTCGTGIHYKAVMADFAYLGGGGSGSAALPGANTFRFGIAYTFTK
jgi:hypothetical protein